MNTHIDMLALQRLYHWEATTPHRVCFTQPVGQGIIQTFTWSEVTHQVRCMANHLLSLGYPPGSRIAIWGKNTAHWLIADWAIWMAGHVSVPLYPTLATKSVRQILDHSGACLMFVGKLDDPDAMRAGVPEQLPCIRLPLSPQWPGTDWSDIVRVQAPLTGQVVRPAQDLCTVMYTSGTTGNPKGVMHTFGTLQTIIAQGLERIPLNETDRMLSYLPLSHIAERGLVEHMLLATGMQVFFAESQETFAQDLQRARPTFFFSVPRLWLKFREGVNAKMPPKKLALLLKIPLINRIVQKKILTALGLDQCRVAAGGAAPMPPELLRWYGALGLNLIELYGMTENGCTHSTDVRNPLPGSVGQVLNGVKCRLDPETSEVQVLTPGLMRGYFLEPELTAQAFTPDGWLHTGDKGALDAKGNLKLTGRVKDLFKTSKGKYVAPAPIESLLALIPGVEACCVVGANLTQPLAILALTPERLKQALDPQERQQMQAVFERELAILNQKLDPHERLSCLVLDQIPWTVESGFITPTLKVKRNQIESVYGPSFEAWSELQKSIVWLKASGPSTHS
jgi:long-chain acyl-CoA synthetase